MYLKFTELSSNKSITYIYFFKINKQLTCGINIALPVSRATGVNVEISIVVMRRAASGVNPTTADINEQNAYPG